MNPLRIALPFLFATVVLGHGYGGGHGSGGYAEYDCGGTCGGGCGYGNPCNSAPAAPIIAQSGCATGECGYSGHSGSSRSASHAGYHKSVTTVTKETRNDELKIVVGKPAVHRATYIEPQPVVHRTTYIEPQPVIRKTTYIQEPAPQPVVYHKKQRYVDEGDYAASGCAGPCGGGSKIVKIIKKTTYAGDGGSCSTCGAESYSGDLEYSEPTVVRKVTRIVTQPKVLRVVKTSVVDQEPSGEYYDSGSSYSGHQGGHHGHGGGHGGYGGGHGGYGRQKSYGGGGAKAGAFAFASASASAGAGSLGGSGDYSSGGGGGCKSGCDQWKK